MTDGHEINHTARKFLLCVVTSSDLRVPHCVGAARVGMRASCPRFLGGDYAETAITPRRHGRRSCTCASGGLGRDAAVVEADQLFELQNQAHRKHERATKPMPEALRVRPDDEALGLPGFEREAYERIMAAEGYPVRDEHASHPSRRDEYWSLDVDMMRRSKWHVLEKLDFPAGVQPYLHGGIVGAREVEPSPAARARAAEIIAAWDEWKANRPPTETDLDEEDDIDWQDADTKANEIAEDILAIPARTATGLRIKAKVVAWSIRERREDEMEGLGPQDDLVLLDTLLKDVLALSPAA